MNLTNLSRASSLSSSRTLNRSIKSKLISCFSISYKPISTITPKTPLFLKPPKFTTTLTDLQKFQTWAKTLIQLTGSSFSDSDNGPDPTILHRELNWLIEDAQETPNSDLNSTTVQLRTGLNDFYDFWKQRIEKRRPFQYIVGCEHWRDFILSVEEGVLIPRPETELIVDLVDNLIKESDFMKNGLWVDLGTGSGAIAIGIGRVLGEFGRVVATDLSPVAVRVASFNVQRIKFR